MKEIQNKRKIILNCYLISTIKCYMKKLLLLPLLCSLATALAQPSTERWGRYEIVLNGPTSGNPFRDVWLKADFTQGDKKITVSGFYDGDGIYKARFMPGNTGEWQYITRSNNKALNGKKGSFTCVAPKVGNHGPVKVANTWHFKYADGQWYYPFGTTIYAWTHQGEALQEQTLQSLATSGFNKVRMCVFPKYYTYVEDDPALFPFPLLSFNANGHPRFTWDLSRFDPAFFRHLEKRVDELAKLGIEADLILFHPYDKGRWGFDSLGKEVDTRYLQYITARLSSFRNVWWSMANEYDFVKTKTREVWDDYTQTVVDDDPFHHLCSIHNGSVYYDLWKPNFTHASIQNGAAVEDFGRAILQRNMLFKPVVYDEVCYEGNIDQRWGRLSGEEMVHAFWQGIIAGTYVTHGETIQQHPRDTIFWARGGRFRGSSPPRIAFLRRIMEAGPGPLELADMWKDHQTAQSDTGYYLIYFGRQMPGEWTFNLPKKNGPAAGAKYKVDIIDTWDMTITPVPDVFVTAAPDGYRIFDKQMKKIKLPVKPYLAVRLTKIK
jgi:hypothetical protein